MVSVRRPDELWSSQVRYKGWQTGQLNQLKDHVPQASAHPKDLYGVWVLHDTKRSMTMDDIYLCVGSGMPEVHEQLREALNDKRIKPLQRENVNDRVNDTSIATLTVSQQARVMNFLKPSFRVWMSKCGHREPSATRWLLSKWLEEDVLPAVLPRR
jgi:hypothetical protein